MYLIESHGNIFKIITENRKDKSYKVHRLYKDEKNHFTLKADSDLDFIKIEDLNNAYILRKRLKRDLRFLNDEIDEIMDYNDDEKILINFNKKNKEKVFLWRENFIDYCSGFKNSETEIINITPVLEHASKIKTPISNPRYIKGNLISYKKINTEYTDLVDDAEKVMAIKRDIYVFDEKSDTFFITIDIKDKDDLIDFFNKSKYRVVNSIKINDCFYNIHFQKTKNKSLVHF